MAADKLQKVEAFIGSQSREIVEWYQKHKAPFWSAYLVSLIAYSYFFTQLGFNNHTFPQVWDFNFPSYRTTTEGRWFSDLLLWCMGGVGVSSSQMYIAAGLHVVNAILIVEIVGYRGKFITFLAAVFLSVYPAFLDRYNFPGSQIIFVFTDTLVILGVLVLARQKKPWKALVGASLCFFLCLASYQPNITLAAFLLLGYCLLVLLRTENSETNNLPVFPTSHLVTAAASLMLGGAVYYVSMKLTMTVPLCGAVRSNLNNFSEILQQLGLAYPVFVKYYTTGADYLPVSLRWLPLTVIFLGAVTLIAESWRKGTLVTITVVVLLGLIPIALHATYILNAKSYVSGRLVFAYGFALLFFLLIMAFRPKLKYFSLAATISLIYFSTMVVTQETNAAYVKLIFDTNKINRVALRIEDVVPDLYKTTSPLVVIGRLQLKNQPKMKRYSNRGNLSHSNSETFEAYRQTEILNFYFGQNVIGRPTKAQVDQALATTSGRQPWPSPESVYVTDGIVVVLLEENKPGVPVTWSR